MNKNFIAAAVAAAFIAAPLAAQASEAELLARIEKLAAELDAVKAALKASTQKTDAVAQQQQAIAAAPAATAGAPATVLTGYGEVNYNRPTKNASAAQTDVRRAVIGIQHRFDEKTKLVSEFEWEHAVTSADDAGEAAIEQLYVEHQFNNGLRAKAGLFLIPSGLLNVAHEPTAYYGVERNFVETAIIPTTWREAGIGLSGDFGNGFAWDAGLTTGFDMTKWDGASEEGLESPLGSIHQEGQLAKSRDMSVHGALNWRGVPGLLLGGSVFSGKAGHKTADFPSQDARVTLWDLHGRYTPGRWDLSALYARGHISNVDALNLGFAAEVAPIPKSFDGWYLQAAYQLFKSSDYALSPFVRYEQFNTASSFTPAVRALGAKPGVDEKVATIGANLRVGEGVVLKADYQKFSENESRDRLNLGVGFSY